jgi:S1-C subfamily serine protease
MLNLNSLNTILLTYMGYFTFTVRKNGKEMFLKRFSNITLAILITFVLAAMCGCSPTVYNAESPTPNGKYDSEFPYRSSSKELEKIGKCVVRINSMAFYKTYLFNAGTKVKLSDINDNFLKSKSNSTGYFDKTSAGSGLTIYSIDNKIAVLTCAHVVSFPDTIYSHYTDDKGKFTDYLESLSIKVRQMIFVAGFPDGGEVELLAIDQYRDLAVLGRTFTSLQSYDFPVFPYPKGEAKQLQWGTFVYIFGYPMNYKMVSRAIVSSPNIDNNGSFLLDAVVNRGFSGGIVVAIRDGVPNFEMVGMIRSVPEDAEYVLEPEKLKNEFQYNPVVPYRGDMFAIQKEDLKYGIAKVVPIEAIKEFLHENSRKFSDMGYDNQKFF